MSYPNKSTKIESTRTFGQFIKFGLVGTSGMVVAFLVINLVMLTIKDFIIANVIAFPVAVTWNFFWNRKFTFSQTGNPSLIKQWIMFVCASLVGLVGNWAIAFSLYFGLDIFRQHYNLAVICGVLAGYLLNFAIAKCIVFETKYTVVISDDTSL